MDRDRFIALWSRCGGRGDDARSVFGGVEASYAESHRHYHTASHVAHCLRQFDLARGEMEDADSIELALWFHDVVYQPDAPDNEMASAERFKRSALETMSDDLVRQVHRLIMATTHENPPASIDEQFVVDIDLSSFGLPWDRFSQDSRNVRREFPHLSDREFARSSGKFLSRLLDRPGVYSTPFFKARLEETARENLRRQIAILESTLS